MATKQKGKTILALADEFVEFSKYRQSLKEFNLKLLPLVDSRKACLVSFSNSYVIDSGATDHMTDNPNTFSTFWSHKAPFHVTVANGSTCKIVGSETIKASSSITLSSVLNLPKLAFNLIYVSKLTRGLNCYVMFFLNHCMFHDLATHKVISKGHLFDNVYILDEYEPRFVACLCLYLKHIVDYDILLYLCQRSSIPVSKSSFFGWWSMPICKRSSQHIWSNELLDGLSQPLSLIHSNVRELCPIVFKTRHKYFVTSVDDFSHLLGFILSKVALKCLFTFVLK